MPYSFFLARMLSLVAFSWPFASVNCVGNTCPFCPIALLGSGSIFNCVVSGFVWFLISFFGTRSMGLFSYIFSLNCIIVLGGFPLSSMDSLSILHMVSTSSILRVLLPCSDYSFVRGHWSHTLPDWYGCSVHIELGLRWYPCFVPDFPIRSCLVSRYWSHILSWMIRLFSPYPNWFRTAHS